MSDTTDKLALDDDALWDMPDSGEQQEDDFDPDRCPDCNAETMGEGFCLVCGWDEHDDEQEDE